MLDFILASSSPTRRDVLAKTDLQFRCIPSNLDETTIEYQGNPASYVTALALAKAEAVAKQFPRSIVIGADTVVYHKGKILGKPKGPRHARTMIAGYSDNGHAVFTGMCVRYKKRTAADCSHMNVAFRELTPTDIDAHIDSKEWVGRAGGYAAFGRGAGLIEHYTGDMQTAAGLNLVMLFKLFRALKIPY